MLFNSLRNYINHYLVYGMPTPLAINVAKKGIKAKPINSIFNIIFNLETNCIVTFGRVPLLIGIAHKR